ncbi:hypothetical protein HL658_28885 [Azospirillum sp. RWY-5-1]|uniref:Uncharacterized protein n=1 Tax=Azospirillum oleiclasticum TaxID=2735135 RepID=A0ABX2TI02_9PROT|nr:hypothetical protein [Azospirillum oleiclasticum]NYZ16579.1 hypothetical protein [Azospirillum oleiclasticum]NYZ23951.1 hypothetical protein [Azospirillum oleiclasticum]
MAANIQSVCHSFLLQAGLYSIRLNPGPDGGFAVAFLAPAAGEAGATFLGRTGTDSVVLAAGGQPALCQVHRDDATLYVSEFQPGATVTADRRVVVKLLDLDTGRARVPVASRPVAAAAAAPVSLAATPTLTVAAVVAGAGERVHANGEWAGAPGTTALDGFTITLGGGVPDLGIEYRCGNGALGLTPWARGGRYCGTKNKAVVITKFAVRLTGPAAEAYDVRYQGEFLGFGESFVARNGELCTITESAPLTALRVEVVPRPRAEAACDPDPERAQFDEQEYLLIYPDAATAVSLKEFESGFHHFVARGRAEGRTAPRRRDL